MRQSFRNFSWLLLADGVSKITNFGYVLLLTNSLVVSGFGIYSYILAFVELFAVFYDLGLNTGSIKLIASEPNKEYSFVKKAVMYKSLTAIVCSLIIVLISNLIGDTKEILLLLFIYLIGYSVRSFSTFFQCLIIAHEKLKLLAILRILENVLLISGTFIIFYFAPSIKNYLLYSTGLSFILFGTWFYYSINIRKVIARGKSKIPVQFSSIFKLSLPFFLISLFTYIYFKIDITMLNHMKDAVQVGYYSVGYRIFVLIMTIPWILNRNILLPKLIKDKTEDDNFILNSFPLYFRIGLILPIGICFLIAFLSEEILTMLFGVEYSNGSIPLSILIWSIPFCTLGAYFNNILILKSPNTLAKVAGLLLVPTNIILNIPMINIFGAAGAASTTLITEATGCVAGYICCRRLGVALPINIRLSILPTITALLIVVFLTHFFSSTIMIIVLFLGYYLIIYITGGFKDINFQNVIMTSKSQGQNENSD